MTTEIVSVGVSDLDGLSVTLHTEVPPGGTEPDRLAIEVRIPVSTLRRLVPATGDAGNATAIHRNDNALARFRRRLKSLRRDPDQPPRIDRTAAEVEAAGKHDTA